jgi:hypothetical protein
VDGDVVEESDMKKPGWQCPVALAALGCLLALSSAYAQSTNYTQSTTFSTVRLSYADLADLAVRLHDLVAQANVAAKCASASEDLTVGDGSSSVELSGAFSQSSFRGAPAVAYTATYSYRCYEAPISAVTLSLADFRRELTVSGRSRDQVAALSAVGSELVRQHESGVGGLRVRYIGACALLLLASVIASSGSYLPYRTLKVVSWTAGPLLSLSVWVFPWDRWLPGAAFYAGDAAFLVRHAALVSFCGAVLTIITFVISMRLSRRPAPSGARSAKEPRPASVHVPRKRRR